MRHFWIALVPTFFLMAATAHAQEDAGVGEAEGETADASDAASASPEGAPPPVLPASVAPAVIPAPRQRVAPLKYDAAEDARYRAAITFGVMLEVGGVAALVSSVAFAFSAGFNGYGYGGGCGDEVDESQNDCEENLEEESKRYRTAAWVLLPVGVVAIAVGIPVIIHGAKGHKQQKHLLWNNAVSGAPHLTALALTTFPSRGGAAGGLTLSGSF